MMRIESILCILPLLFCCYCKSNPITNENVLFPESDRKALAEYRKEVDIGRDMAGRILQFYGTYSDQKLTRYINEVGNYLSRFTDNNDRRYMIAILDTQSIETFACPGGYILLSLGLLQNLKNEAELAMILSHDIAHVEQRHLFLKLKHLQKRDIKPTKHIDIYLQARLRHPGTYSDTVESDIFQYFSGKTGPAAGLVEASKIGLSIILERGLDKDLEFEADQVGLQIAVRASYDPFAMRELLTRLDRNRKDLDLSLFEKTHPKLPERLATLDTYLQKIDAQEIVGARGETRFREYTKHIMPKDVE